MYMFTLFQAYSALEYTLELMQIALLRAKKHLVDMRMTAYMCNAIGLSTCMPIQKPTMVVHKTLLILKGPPL